MKSSYFDNVLHFRISEYLNAEKVFRDIEKWDLRAKRALLSTLQYLRKYGGKIGKAWVQTDLLHRCSVVEHQKALVAWHS